MEKNDFYWFIDKYFLLSNDKSCALSFSFVSERKNWKMADPQIAQWFHTVDKNRTGKLSALELQQALRNNNYTTFDIQVVQVRF